MTTTTATEDRQLAYSIAQAAQKSGLSQSTIRRAISEGYLPTVTPKGTSKPLIRHEALNAWLDGE